MRLLIVVAALLALPAVAQECPTACAAVDLILRDVSCAPPHGGGPDGRAWFALECGKERAPMPFDWQLAELSGDRGYIFAWTPNAHYAYVEAATGRYQAGALTVLGEVNVVFDFPPKCNWR